jgi:excisionase family DNA binding protein
MELLNIKELATYLRLGERTVYKLVRDKTIPSIKIGGVYRFNKEEIDKWITEKQVDKAKPKALKQQNDQNILEKIKCEADTLTKRLLFVGLITKKLEDQDVKPVIVGGNAVEFYTAGGYATADIDIVCPSEPLEPVLLELGFEKEGRYWLNDDLGIVIEAPSSYLDAPAKERIVEVQIENMVVYIFGIEDLIVDRLSAFMYWASGDDFNWAKELANIHKEQIDWKYLGKTAQEGRITDALKKLISDLKLRVKLK